MSETKTMEKVRITPKGGIELRTGIKYKTAGGDMVMLYAKDRIVGMWRGVIMKDIAERDVIETWFSDGSHLMGAKSPLDIVGEWREPPKFDRKLLPAWARHAVAMDANGSWSAYSATPTQCDDEWLPDPKTKCFISCIPEEMYPEFHGDWKESLIIYAD